VSRVVIEALPDHTDGVRERVLGDERVGPRGREQVVLEHDLARTIQQADENLRRPGRNGYILAGAGQSERLGVE